MTADYVSAVATAVLSLAAIVGGGWGLYSYHQARRVEAARWLQGVFKDFYLSTQFKDVCRLLEYDFDTIAGPLLERRITDRHVPVTPDEVEILSQLDTLLNYFEHVLYLENESHLTERDRQAVFEYWFDIMGEDQRAGLRRYIARFGFERIAKVLNAPNEDYIAVYGSLREGLALPDLPDDVGQMLQRKGPCIIQGELYDLGDYPGLLDGDGTVVGELYTITDLKALRLLDTYERYDASDRAGSLYIRKCVRLAQPVGLDAWVYFYNQPLDGAPHIASGDWASYITTR